MKQQITVKEELEELLRQYAGCGVQSVTRLTAAGSNRVYYRLILADGSTVVGVEGTNADENRAFLVIGRPCRVRQRNVLSLAGPG